MGFSDQSPSPPHLYSQALQLKLYQAFIFSIPILFSIILFLLFYLFYLKKRAAASTLSSHPPPILPTSSNQPTQIYMASVCEVRLKGDLKDKLLTIVFDEDSRTMDSACCVCLGEFEMKEELVQVPSCKHVFHVECIRHWLRSNTTCPLCRCSVVVVADTATTTKLVLPPLLLNITPTPQSNHHQHQLVSNTTNEPTGGGSSSNSISNACLMVSHI